MNFAGKTGRLDRRRGQTLGIAINRENTGAI